MKRLSISQIIAGSLLAGIVVLVIVFPLLPGYDPYEQNLAAGLVPVGGRTFDGRLYLLGSDTLGRDILSRLALAGQVSILIGLSAVIVSLVIGVFLGLASLAVLFFGPTLWTWYLALLLR